MIPLLMAGMEIARTVSMSLVVNTATKTLVFCYDDKFSSFLNSLINDVGDPFGNIIPISQPLQMDDCKDGIVGASSSSLGHD
uniref:Putative myb-related protein 5 n=1 Tax=Arabidopsis thaliana TaxID=3702 RepID=Q8GW84_ARATH|nr:putative myb-related protein 5 [Arabidopsis thaliana]